MALNIGPGVQAWIDQNEGTPKSDENYISSEQSITIVELSDASGAKVNWMVLYNSPTNEVIPFVQAEP